MKYNALKYSLKIWLTSVVVAPLLFLIITTTVHAPPFSDPDNLSGSIFIYFLMIPVQLIGSLLTWLLFMLIIRIVIDFCNNAQLWKSIIFITGLLLTVGSFRLAFSDIFHGDNECFYLMLCNCFCIGCGTWLYTLKPVTTEVEI